MFQIGGEDKDDEEEAEEDEEEEFEEEEEKELQEDEKAIMSPFDEAEAELEKNHKS